MARFRNRSSNTLYVPELHTTVQPDEVVDAPGDVVGQSAGAFIVMRPDGARRLWPESTWAEVAPAPAPKKAAAKESKEEE